MARAWTPPNSTTTSFHTKKSTTLKSWEWSLCLLKMMEDRLVWLLFESEDVGGWHCNFWFQFKCDYVLARQSQFKLCSISSERRDSADFDTTVIIGQVIIKMIHFGELAINLKPLTFQVEDPSSQLMKLKYFLILTSKREIYPTIGNDKNQGQFK